MCASIYVRPLRCSWLTGGLIFRGHVTDGRALINVFAASWCLMRALAPQDLCSCCTERGMWHPAQTEAAIAHPLTILCSLVHGLGVANLK